jgi:hypothetical protein
MALSGAPDVEVADCGPAAPPSTTRGLVVCEISPDGTSVAMPYSFYPTVPNQALLNLDLRLPVRVRKLVQISNLHPAQWQGRTESGDYIFVRYRYGRLWIGIAPDYHRTPPTTVFETGYGDLGDGYLSFRLLRARTRGVVEWPKRTSRPGLTL